MAGLRGKPFTCPAKACRIYLPKKGEERDKKIGGGAGKHGTPLKGGLSYETVIYPRADALCAPWEHVCQVARARQSRYRVSDHLPSFVSSLASLEYLRCFLMGPDTRTLKARYEFRTKINQSVPGADCFSLNYSGVTNNTSEGNTLSRA